MKMWMLPIVSQNRLQRLRAWLLDTKTWASDVRVFSFDTVVVLAMLLIAGLIIIGTARRFMERGGYVVLPTEVPDKAYDFGLAPELLQSRLMRALRKMNAESVAMSAATVEAEMVLGETDTHRGGGSVLSLYPRLPPVDVKLPNSDVSIGVVDSLTERAFGSFETPIRSRVVCTNGDCDSGKFKLIVTISSAQSESFDFQSDSNAKVFDAAAQWIQQVIDPYYLASWEFLHKKPEAEKHALQAAFYFPERRASAWALIGLMRLRDWQLESADLYFQKALSYDHKNIVAIAGISEIYKQSYKYEKLVQNLYRSNIVIYEKLSNFITYIGLKDCQDDYSAFSLRGNELISISQKRGSAAIQKAILVYRFLAFINRSKPAVANNLGTALNEIGQYEEAIQQYARAAGRNPFDDRVLGNEGRAYLKLERLWEARNAFTAALAIAPANPTYLRGLNCVSELAFFKSEAKAGRDRRTIDQWVNDCAE